MNANIWREYDSACEYHALHDKLPELVSDSVMRRINQDTDAFMVRVRAFKYAIASESFAPEEDTSRTEDDIREDAIFEADCRAEDWSR